MTTFFLSAAVLVGIFSSCYANVPVTRYSSWFLIFVSGNDCT